MVSLWAVTDAYKFLYGWLYDVQLQFLVSSGVCFATDVIMLLQIALFKRLLCLDNQRQPPQPQSVANALQDLDRVDEFDKWELGESPLTLSDKPQSPVVRVGNAVEDGEANEDTETSKLLL